jgi:16S rRNA G966 N2-methylase RsmD
MRHARRLAADMDLLQPSIASSWKRFRRWYLRPWWTARYGQISVYYKKHLDGGGSSFGQGYIPFLKSRGMPKQPRVFEWCSGPAFIGFSILAHGLCDTLCLADINEQAVEACRRTIRANGLAERVSLYQSDNLHSIPPSEQWDLVVGNPPFYNEARPWCIRSHDKDWSIHRRFFADVGRFLKPGGVILLQEANDASTPENFREMIHDAGLSVVLTHNVKPSDMSHYYLGIVRRSESPPNWLVAPLAAPSSAYMASSA